MSLTFPNESIEYRTARNALLIKEIELRRATEAVAAARRALPLGGALPEDYRFEELDAASAVRSVKLSELFGGNDALAIYSYMFGPERDKPCPMCTPLLDGLNGVEDHIRQRVSLVVVAQSPAERLWQWARTRGWQRLRLLSCATSNYNNDYHGKTPRGDTTMLNVFRRAGSEVRHFWGSELAYGPSDPGQDPRGLDTLNPVFQMFDLTPVGREKWYTKLQYEVVGVRGQQAVAAS
jgi:predicted dithiol-disulfide oxidoreductase (DUF899 family)